MFQAKTEMRPARCGKQGRQKNKFPGLPFGIELTNMQKVLKYCVYD